MVAVVGRAQRESKALRGEKLGRKNIPLGKFSVSLLLPIPKEDFKKNYLNFFKLFFSNTRASLPNPFMLYARRSHALRSRVLPRRSSSALLKHIGRKGSTHDSQGQQLASQSQPASQPVRG